MKKYSGNSYPYIYGVFCERDRGEAQGLLERLSAAEKRVCWPDGAFSAGEKRKLKKASAAAIFLSPDAVADEAFPETADYAVRSGVPFVFICLRETELSDALRLLRGSTEGIKRAGGESEAAFAARLLASPVMRSLSVTPLQKRACKRTLAGMLAGALAALLLLFLPLYLIPRQQKQAALDALGVTGLTADNLAGITELYIVGEVSYWENVSYIDAWPDGDDPDLFHYEYCRADGTWEQELTTRRGNITDIAAVAYMPNLERLYIEGQQITDLSPVYGLKKLAELSVNCNPISDLSGIEQLQQLQHLSITGTEVSDLRPVFQLAQLESLQLTNTPAASLEGIGSLGRLQALFASNTGITDLSPLRDLGEKLGDRPFTLDISSAAPMTGIGALQAFAAFGKLGVADVPFRVLLPLLEGKTVEDFTASHSGVTEIKQLYPIHITQRLDVCWTDSLVSIEGIGYFDTVEEVKLSWCRNLQDFTPLLEMQNLKTIRVSSDQYDAVTEQLAGIAAEITVQD